MEKSNNLQFTFPEWKNIPDWKAAWDNAWNNAWDNAWNNAWDNSMPSITGKTTTKKIAGAAVDESVKRKLLVGYKRPTIAVSVSKDKDGKSVRVLARKAA